MVYTTNGSTPTRTNGAHITGSTGTASVPANATLKAFAYKTNWNDSAVKSGAYTVKPACATPVLNPPEVDSGPRPPVNYSVQISTTTSGGWLSYTRDGSAPTHSHGTIVQATSTSVTIGAHTSALLTALAFKQDNSYVDSGLASGYFDNQNDGRSRPRHKGKGGGEALGRTLNTGGVAKAAGANPRAIGFGLDPAFWGPDGLRQLSKLVFGWTNQRGGNRSRGQGNQPDSTHTVTYNLDNCGNRTSVDDTSTGTVVYGLNNLNQYTSVGGSSLLHGQSHEITQYNGTYSYIGDSYLAQAVNGGNTLQLYYDALGRCVTRKLNGIYNFYIFDGEHWVVEFDASNVIASNALYGRRMDELIARSNGAAPAGSQGQWFFPDRNGNISLITDSTDVILESYRYDAFGKPSIFDGSGAPIGATGINNRFMFTGREWRNIFGFYEYRARAYNPTIGRFMSEDPKGFDAGDYNLYRYVGNNPMNLSDPSGMGAEKGNDGTYSFVVDPKFNLTALQGAYVNSALTEHITNASGPLSFLQALELRTASFTTHRSMMSYSAERK